MAKAIDASGPGSPAPTRFVVVGACLVVGLTASVALVYLRSPRVVADVSPLAWAEVPLPPAAEVAVVHAEGGLRFMRVRIGDERFAVIESGRRRARVDTYSWNVVRRDGRWVWAVARAWSIDPELRVAVSDDDGATFRLITLPNPNPAGTVTGSEVLGERFSLSFQGGNPLEPPWVWWSRLPARVPRSLRVVTKNGGQSWRLELSP